MPRPGNADGPREGVIVPKIYMLLTKGPWKKWRHYFLGTRVIVVAGSELFPEPISAEGHPTFPLLEVGEKALEGGNYAFQSDIIVPVQRGSQVVMARCADCFVYLASVGPRAILGLAFSARYGLVVLPDPGCLTVLEYLFQGSPSDKFDCKSRPPETQTPLQPAGSRELERDVKGVENYRQLCRPMQGSAAVCYSDNKNLNASQGRHKLVSIDISDSSLQLQELQQSSSLQQSPWGVSSHELAPFEGAKMNAF